jgi:hypothetical protein
MITWLKDYVLVTVGKSGSGYLDDRSPCNSEGHSAPAYGRDSHLAPTLWAIVLAPTRPLHCFWLCKLIVRVYTLRSKFCQVRLKKKDIITLPVPSW